MVYIVAQSNIVFSLASHNLISPVIGGCNLLSMFMMKKSVLSAKKARKLNLIHVRFLNKNIFYIIFCVSSPINHYIVLYKYAARLFERNF